MFSIGDSGLVDEDANASARPPERHDVERLAGAPQRTTAASSANGIVMTTMPALRQSRRKSSTNQSGQQRTENRLANHRSQRRRDV
jgi:hypothetical protein